MKYSWMLSLLLVLLVAAPLQAVSADGEPSNVEVIDVPNDGGSAIGVLWDWAVPPADGARLLFEVRIPQELIDAYALTADEQARLDAARDKLAADLEPLLPQRADAKEAMDAAQEVFNVAAANSKPETGELRREYYAKKQAYDDLERKITKAKERFTSAVMVKRVNLQEKARMHDYLEASAANLGWVATDVIIPAGAASTMASEPGRFGHHPDTPEKNYVEINSVKVAHPGLFDGTFESTAAEEKSTLDDGISDVISVSLKAGMTYEVRMREVDGLAEDAELKPLDLYTNGLAGIGATIGESFELGASDTAINYFDASKTNNLIFATVFAAIILAGIMVARRNPNIFIRRIQGLEAVDEAIGRATEMGKPVLYLCGLDPLSTLPTIAAVNILGRVARRIADYDSDLVVPCRDPVVLTVAQEVCKEAYMDAGRPDAYREDNIYFVTDDQFSYTATTCAIMMREKPAANFFMGYYYAESLLLAETGAATGAIQIAGTDALHQLPFFITTCDYTLIGEELYAASAYLSREPMLLGSLKGQDISKAVFMVVIIVQTLLFIFNGDWNWLRILVEPL